MSTITLVHATDDADVHAAARTLGDPARAVIAGLTTVTAGKTVDPARLRSAIQAASAERSRLMALLGQGEPWFRAHARRSGTATDAQRVAVIEQEARWIALLRCYEAVDRAIRQAMAATLPTERGAAA